MATAQTRRRNTRGRSIMHNPDFSLSGMTKGKTMAAKPKQNRKRRKTSTRSRRRNTSTKSAAVRAASSTARKATPNPRRRRSTSHRRRTGKRNPATRAKRNPSRGGLLRNPFELSIGALLFTAGGVVAFEAVKQRIFGSQTGAVDALVKIGGGFAMAKYGRRTPLIGKYAGTIGGGLMLLGAVDLFRMYVIPQVQQAFPSWFGGQAQLPAPQGQAGLMGGGGPVYGYNNEYNESGFPVIG